MINYMYWEKSKYVEKECDDWSVLENLGGAKIETKQNESEQKTLKEINQRLAQQKGKTQELFSKSSKQFVRKILEGFNKS